jgi:hypothetical protein
LKYGKVVKNEEYVYTWALKSVGFKYGDTDLDKATYIKFGLENEHTYLPEKSYDSVCNQLKSSNPIFGKKDGKCVESLPGKCPF